MLMLAITFFSYYSQAQVANVIANGSFEKYYNCTAPFPLSKAEDWISIDSLSYGGVYFNICNSYVPLSGNTYQYPKTGGAFIISTFYDLNTGRGYLKNRLKQNLKAGNIYCVKFYVNIANTSPRGIDGFGIYFGGGDIDTITKCNIPLSFITPQVKNPIGNVISDTLNWVPVTGTFVANGTEKYALIGNFLADNSVTTASINTPYYPQNWTDVLIDDVSCIDVDLPADAGLDTICLPGTSVYIGRPRDVGIDEDCTWYQLPNMTTAIDTAAGLWVSPVATTTYVVRQDICGMIKWDTVVVSETALGIQDLKFNNQSVTVYPVPAKDELTISFTADGIEKAFTKAEILNGLGQWQLQSDLNFSNRKATIVIKELPDGVYVLRLKGTHSETISRRFIVSHN